MKRILVPTDFSKLSEQAVDYAIFIAKQIGGSVQVVHFVDIPTEEVTLVTGDTQVVETTEETLYNIQLMQSNKYKLEKIADKSTKAVPISADIYGNGFLKGTKKYVDFFDIDLIVIGTTGEESIQEYFSGNHTEQLIETVGVPIVSIKGPIEQTPIKEIVLGVDLVDEEYEEEVYPVLKDIFDSFGARVHLVNVVRDSEPGQPTLAMSLDAFARKIGLKNYEVSILQNPSDEEGLEYYASHVNADMVALISDARTGIFRFTQLSFASHLSKTIDLPLLSLNQRRLHQSKK